MEKENNESTTLETLLSANELMNLLSISSTTLWRHVNKETLPKPLCLGKKRYWRYSDVIESISTSSDR